LRRAVASWYENRDADSLAYQVVKYQSRNGFTHRDLLRLSHPDAGEDKAELYDWICGREVENEAEALPLIVRGFEAIKTVEDTKLAIQMISDYKLPWEAVPSQLLGKAETWQTLLDSGSLPFGAMLRNLARMTANGLISPGSEASRQIVARLGDVE